MLPKTTAGANGLLDKYSAVKIAESRGVETLSRRNEN